MKKILAIGWKDLLILFQDKGALVLMLGAPFVLTLGLGLVTGAFSRNSGGSGPADIPVLLVNLDEGPLGQALVDLFYSEDLAQLLAPATAVSAEEARQQVNDDKVAAAVIIPAGFSAGVLPDNQTGQGAQATTIELYANPGRVISAGVVGNVVAGFINQVESNLASVTVSMAQLMMNGQLSANDMAEMISLGQAMGERQFAQTSERAALIQIEREGAAEVSAQSNPLVFIAPGMAVAFLMYTVALGGRSILAERDGGTLARLLVSPTSTAQVLAGKVVGIFLTGAAQVSVLIVASALLFGLRWGSAPGVALLIIMVAAAATGWGLLLAAIASRPGQVANYGTALMLTFGIIGGSFITLPTTGFLAQLGKITPNAWAISGFGRLAQGGRLGDILPDLAALLVMAATLFAVAAFIFQRRKNQLLVGG
jgi:ABC-2 type transport system permease protein